MAVGYAGVAAAFLFAAGVAILPLAPLILWIVFFVILDLAYGWTEPPIQSLVSRDSPPTVNATMMALLKVSTMFSYFLLGWLGRFFEPLGASLYWLLTAALGGSAVLLLVLFGRPVMTALEPVGPQPEGAGLLSGSTSISAALPGTR
jgi:POT family proton-dependent oligopeptide transporter